MEILGTFLHFDVHESVCAILQLFHMHLMYVCMFDRLRGNKRILL